MAGEILLPTALLFFDVLLCPFVLRGPGGGRGVGLGISRCTNKAISDLRINVYVTSS